MKKIILKFSLFLLLFTAPAYTQSVAVNDSAAVSDTVYIMAKSPWGAVARSAILPGLGQYYNESYWKIPVVWGFLGFFGWNSITNQNNYADYRDLYETSGFQNESYKRLRDFYRDQRDYYLIIIGLTYLLNMIDAYVDAHLFDFNVTDDLGGTKMNIGIKVNLP